MFWAKFKDQEKKNKQCHSWSSTAKGVPSYSDFLFYLGLQLFIRDPLTLGREVCLTQSSDLKASLIWTHLTETARKMFVQISWSPVNSQIDT